MKFLLKAFRNGLGALIAFISRLIPTNKIKRDAQAQELADVKAKNIELYQFFACPFCIMSRRVIRRLNIKIVTRNAQAAYNGSDTKYRQEMLKETGKIQVPCLKITDGDKVTWLFESAEIKTYLEKEFGEISALASV
ncbi:glutaredoxin family protein [Candidatus Thioglobus sp.]|uniref:glutaredoxin family protein n=1 Tax=Candidatus Thioglobus sp. TaxID=2026721 RepID=UPI003D105ADC